jgi:alpha-glucosidase
MDEMDSLGMEEKMIMKKHRFLSVIALITLFTIACSTQKNGVTVRSPDGNIAIQFRTANENEWGKNVPTYSIEYMDKKILENSRLGLILKNGIQLDRDLKIKKVTSDEGDETYFPVVGKHQKVRNHYQQACIHLQTTVKPTVDLNIWMRAYDDGVAFRYEIPEQKNIKEIAIVEERSGFRMAADGDAWVLPLKSFATNYENNYQETKISKIETGTIIGLPLTVEIDSACTIAITEANLQDYAGMYLSHDAENALTLNSRLSPFPGDSALKVMSNTPLHSPWRVVMIGRTPGDLIESEIVPNLNDPCAIQDPSWIKPGIAAWDWWANQIVKNVDFECGMNTPTMKYYIQFAGEMGWEYMLIDAGWYGAHNDPQADITTTIEDIDMKEILDYAKQKNVGVILWLNWRNVDRQMDDAFPLYEKWGVKGIKVDYMNRDDQQMVAYYHRVIRKAVQHHLLVDFHGAYKPTGEQRTWPNQITREAVLAMEYNKWSDRVTPDHDLTVPFTRMLAGPRDYTPGAFRNASSEDFMPAEEAMSQGTRCHQLAMFVIYESELQCPADYPDAYRNQIGIEFLRHVPTTWGDVRVINGQIGDYLTLARRSWDEWYLGSMTDWDPRTFEINLDFLDDKEYVAQIYADNLDLSTQKSIPAIYSEKTVTAKESITLNLTSGGGCVIRFIPN